MPGTWKRDGFRRGGLENKRYRQAIDTRLRRNRRQQKRSRILMGGRERERESNLDR